MDLPFTVDQFLGVFRDYNTAIWPAQIVAYVLGVLVVGLGTRISSSATRVSGWVLSAMWLWMGAIYHLTFFSEINPAAYIFGAFFLIQGLLFLAAAHGMLRFDIAFRHDAYGIAGAILIAYASLVYPVIGAALGHGYPAAPMFGAAPCPTTIFTFGVLLWTKPGVSKWLLVVPGLWSLIGFVAAIQLGILEDSGLLVAALTAIPLVFWRDRTQDRSPSV